MQDFCIPKPAGKNIILNEREVVPQGCYKLFSLQGARLMSDTAVDYVELRIAPVRTAGTVFIGYFLRRVHTGCVLCTPKGVIQMNTRSVQI